jgi:competence ComEA-like helix-hairpin-helix protein
MRVPGIGEVYADRIIAYREQYGNFETLNELTNIKGIGEKRLEKWSTYLIIS